ncbi:hypothetical protein N7451_012420 [Penicillium sp. IBT 35674x]|nr:hypothetical protein N7451_012420 [Penicillium sp. IBT 35674x]
MDKVPTAAEHCTIRQSGLGKGQRHYLALWSMEVNWAVAYCTCGTRVVLRKLAAATYQKTIAEEGVVLCILHNSGSLQPNERFICLSRRRFHN